jgi:hypothetical protein
MLDDFFLKINIEESRFNICRVSVHSAGCHEGQNIAKGAEFHDWGKCVTIFDASTLAKLGATSRALKRLTEPSGLDLTLNTHLLPLA